MRISIVAMAVIAGLALAPAASATSPPPPPPGTVEVPSTVTVGKPSLRGRTLSLPISCVRTVDVRVSYKGRQLGTARARCSDLRATAAVRLSRSARRRLAADQNARLGVVIRDGRTNTRTQVDLSSRAVAKLSYLTGNWWLHAQCNGYNAQLGRPAINATGVLYSNLSGGDTYTIWLRLADISNNQWISNWTKESQAFQVGMPGTGYLPVATRSLFYMPWNRLLAVRGTIYSHRHQDFIYEGWLPANAIESNNAVSGGVLCAVYV